MVPVSYTHLAEAAAQKELDEVKKQIQIEKDEAIRDIRRQVAILSVDMAEDVYKRQEYVINIPLNTHFYILNIRFI